VLDRNVRVGGGELDLVVVRERALRFVEVKARAVGDTSALEALTPRKQRLLRQAAEAYLLGALPPYDEVAFLVAVVTLDPAGWSLDLIDDAFDG